MLDYGSLPEALARLDPVQATTRTPTHKRGGAPFATVVRGIALGEAAVRRMGRAGVPDTCLYRSCARYAMLSGNGVAAELVLGIRGTAGHIEGHAWVEIGGAPFLEVLDTQLVENFRYAPRGRS